MHFFLETLEMAAILFCTDRKLTLNDQNRSTASKDECCHCHISPKLADFQLKISLATVFDIQITQQANNTFFCRMDIVWLNFAIRSPHGNIHDGYICSENQLSIWRQRVGSWILIMDRRIMECSQTRFYMTHNHECGRFSGTWEPTTTNYSTAAALLKSFCAWPTIGLWVKLCNLHDVLQLLPDLKACSKFSRPKLPACHTKNHHTASTCPPIFQFLGWISVFHILYVMP